MYKYTATVTRVLDANTLELLVDLGFGVTIQRVFGVINASAPVFRDPTADHDEAQRAKSDAWEISGHKRVLIETEKVGKYGRYLAKVTLPDGRTFINAMKERGW